MQWAESYYKHIFKLLLLFQKQIGNNIKSIFFIYLKPISEACNIVIQTVSALTFRHLFHKYNISWFDPGRRHKFLRAYVTKGTNQTCYRSYLPL